MRKALISAPADVINEVAASEAASNIWRRKRKNGGGDENKRQSSAKWRENQAPARRKTGEK